MDAPLAAPAADPNEEGPLATTVTRHDGSTRRLWIPFKTPAAEQKRSLFTKYLWAVAVDRVVADGIEIRSQPFNINIGDMDVSTDDVGNSDYIYLVRTNRWIVDPPDEHVPWTLLLLDFRAENPQWALYVIPPTTARLEIRYRIRPKEGPTTPQMEVVVLNRVQS